MKSDGRASWKYIHFINKDTMRRKDSVNTKVRIGINTPQLAMTLLAWNANNETANGKIARPQKMDYSN